MGQYRVHNGMYFGGFEHQEETKFIQNIFRNSTRDYQQVVLLDIHTGYGPRWQMTLVQSTVREDDCQRNSNQVQGPVGGGCKSR